MDKGKFFVIILAIILFFIIAAKPVFIALWRIMKALLSF